jgi:hypothetical protein
MVQTVVLLQIVVSIKQKRINNTIQKTSGKTNNKAKTPLNAILLTVTQGCINNKNHVYKSTQTILISLIPA